MAKSAGKPAYRRVIVKVSGEALSGPEGFGIHQPTIDRIAKDLIAARKAGVTLGGHGPDHSTELTIGAAPALWAELSAKGRERAIQFTWQRTARETISIYERVLGRSLV